MKTYKGKSMRLGGGGRFAKLEDQLAKKPGIYNPAGLAAKIGRKKLGKGKFQTLAAKGHARWARTAHGHTS